MPVGLDVWWCVGDLRQRSGDLRQRGGDLRQRIDGIDAVVGKRRARAYLRHRQCVPSGSVFARTAARSRSHRTGFSTRFGRFGRGRGPPLWVAISTRFGRFGRGCCVGIDHGKSVSSGLPLGKSYFLLTQTPPDLLKWVVSLLEHCVNVQCSARTKYSLMSAR